jgi:hypothetical protein
MNAQLRDFLLQLLLPAGSVSTSASSAIFNTASALK